MKANPTAISDPIRIHFSNEFKNSFHSMDGMFVESIEN